MCRSRALRGRDRGKKKTLMKKAIKKLIILIVVFAIVAGGINALVIARGSKEIVSFDEAVAAADSGQAQDQADCILVLGAQVKPDGTPSKMLKDRLDTAIELYQQGAAPKLLMSGDNGRVEYNEVKVMLAYALDAGVPKEDIFLDHAGFSTYESLYRARDVFGADHIIVVTQKYHEYRALYIGEQLSVDVTGVCTEDIEYAGQGYREIREIAARDKDFFKCITKPEPTYLGEPIDISGDGTVTQ